MSRFDAHEPVCTERSGAIKWLVEPKTKRLGRCDALSGQMAVFNEGNAVSLTATQHSRIMIICGEAMSARHLFLNFVSTSRERIEQAKQHWRDGRFDMVPGDDEFIPLPK